MEGKFTLTVRGIEEVKCFISECRALKKEILDAHKDTCENTTLPTIDDILSDINYGVGVDEDDQYYNSWGVTDNYDLCIGLEKGIDFVGI